MWEGDTNLLLSAGVGGTFMKAFGTAFTGAGLVSCHTHTGAPVGGRALLRGPAAPRAGQSIVPTRQRVRVRWCCSRAREAVWCRAHLDLLHARIRLVIRVVLGRGRLRGGGGSTTSR